MKKVISFGLWGENPKYTIGAIKNADLATIFYPDWICRFYVAKNVPLHVIQELLTRNNTEVFIVNEKPDWTGTFWRFFAACDPFVDVMISRDTDSRLGEREMLAVQEWEHSDWGFHIMRDHPRQGARILAGMWGIKKGIITNMAELIEKYQKKDFYQVDQDFLRKIIYPLVRDNVLIHDPIFDKKPFPSERVGYQFVGQVFDEHDQPVIRPVEQLKEFLQSHPDPFANFAWEQFIKTKINRPFPIWILNLERSRDQREYMEQQLGKLNWQFEIIPAVDGEYLSSEELKYYSSQQAIKTIGREMRLGEIGCALSHAKMWERVVAENIEEVLIFEDDIEIDYQLMDVLERRHTFPEDWEFINFRTDVKKLPFGPPVYSNYRICHFQDYANRTCAYFLNIKGAKKLCDHVYPIRLAADGLTGRTYISGLISYGIYPDLVKLADFSSVRSDNVQVYQRYVHRADPLTNAGATIAKPMTTKLMNIKAYKLYDRAAVVQPAPVERDGDAAPGATSADRAIRAASGTGWVLLCPHAFEATWNGGPNPEDITIRLDAAEDDAPAFVQSNLGDGLLTLYAGYQLQTSGPDRLWVRGPINRPKDGLYAPEQIVDTSLLPATITINWQCTRPNQTVRFEAGEPFCAIIPYPRQYAEQFACDVVELDDDGAMLEQALQQLIQAPDIQAVFQRLQEAAAPAEPQLAASAPEETAARWAAQLSDPPPVSCICPTYGRVELLEEAIYSFLQQDYPGEKELIILNDYDQQTLAFDHPEVQVINVPRRFRTVGEKRNAAIALASYDLLFVWDDDDIYLPHRLSFSVAGFERKKGFFKPDLAWVWYQGQLKGPKRNCFHSQSCWSRKLFDAVQGYDAEGSGHDQLFEKRLAKKFPGSTKFYAIQLEEIYYIYRWAGTDSYHLSAFGGFKPGENSRYNEVADFVQQRASRGEIRRGHIPLQPGWKMDYRQLVSDAIAALAEQHAQEQEEVPM